MGVQLAGCPQCWTMGVRAGTSVKNDCKSVSSPINCFCGDFLNTLINMIWSNSCWRGFLFSHVLQWWIFALNKFVIMRQSLWNFSPQMAPSLDSFFSPLAHSVVVYTFIVLNKQEIRRRDANPLGFFLFCLVFKKINKMWSYLLWSTLFNDQQGETPGSNGALRWLALWLRSTFFWWFYGQNYSFWVIRSKTKLILWVMLIITVRRINHTMLGG